MESDPFRVPDTNLPKQPDGLARCKRRTRDQIEERGCLKSLIVSRPHSRSPAECSERDLLLQNIERLLKTDTEKPKSRAFNGADRPDSNLANESGAP